MTSAHKRRIVVGITLFLLFLFGAVVPYQQNLSANCVVRPATVWSLRHEGSGLLTTGLELNQTGMQTDLQFFQLERPDVFDLKIASGLSEGSFVQAGDTLATLHSRGAEMRTSEVQDELQVEMRKRDALLAGSRQEEIEVAREDVKRAQIRLNTYLPTYERALALQDSNMISDARYDETEARYMELQADLDLKKAELRALVAGAHPAEIRVADAEITRLERLSEANRDLMPLSTPIIAPFSGIFRGGNSNSIGLFSVERSDSLLVHIRIPEPIAGQLNKGTEVRFSFNALPDITISASLKNLAFVEGDSVGAFATALLGNQDQLLQPGMTGIASLPLGRTTLFGRLFRQFGTGTN
ncbi:hypothetical protein KQI63_06565 [bacterium]|nr:hypothetical protein [bacterium]